MKSTRRGFMATLAGLPFVGMLKAKSEPKPDCLTWTEHRFVGGTMDGHVAYRVEMRDVVMSPDGYVVSVGPWRTGPHA